MDSQSRHKQLLETAPFTLSPAMAIHPLHCIQPSFTMESIRCPCEYSSPCYNCEKHHIFSSMPLQMLHDDSYSSNTNYTHGSHDDGNHRAPRNEEQRISDRSPSYPTGQGQHQEEGEPEWFGPLDYSDAVRGENDFGSCPNGRGTGEEEHGFLLLDLNDLIPDWDDLDYTDEYQWSSSSADESECHSAIVNGDTCFEPGDFVTKDNEDTVDTSFIHCCGCCNFVPNGNTD